MIHQRHRQTDQQTDDMRSHDGAVHYSASRGKNYILSLYHQQNFSGDRLPLETHGSPEVAKMEVL